MLLRIMHHMTWSCRVGSEWRRGRKGGFRCYNLGSRRRVGPALGIQKSKAWTPKICADFTGGFYACKDMLIGFLTPSKNCGD
jgi:hypothetical protein